MEFDMESPFYKASSEVRRRDAGFDRGFGR